MVKLTLYIILLLSFSLTSYGKDDKVVIGTVQLDKTLKKDNDLRIMLFNTIDGYSFLKQINLIKVDRRIKKLYKNKAILSMEDAINVSKELKLDVAIVLHSEKKLVVGTNDIATNTNAISTNNIATNTSTVSTNDIATNTSTISTNNIVTNTSTISTNNIATNTNAISTNNITTNTSTVSTNNISSNITNNKNTFTTTYFVQGIDIKTEESIYSNKANSENEVSTLTRELIDVVGISYSRNILDEIESPSSDIDLQFAINIINDDNTKTALTNNSNIYVSDKLEFNFSVNKNGFVTILGFLSDDSILILNPNDFSEITNVLSNQNYSIPNEDSLFDIMVSGSNGIDEYYIIFTEKTPTFITNTKYVNGTGFKSINPSNIPEYSKLIKDELKKEKNWHIQKIKLNINEFFIIKKEDETEDSDL